MRHSLILVMLSFLFVSSAGTRNLVLSEDDLALERELKILNKPYVKSFKDKYGVVFDCVDMYKQPAFDHPLLKNHKLQIKPSSYSYVKSSGTGVPTTSQPARFGLQESCPDGTVLIRRTLKEDLLRARSSSQVFKTQKKYSSGIAGQHFAQLLIESKKDSQFLAASAVVEVYPLTVLAGQSSSAQILVVDDSSSKLSAIQSGWLIDPNSEGDGQTRFMVYWTADGYEHTGCLNMLCPGFVLQSKTTTPGMVLPTGSIALNIAKDLQTGNWNVYVGQEMVGYFPKEIINNMNSSTLVEMGGIVYAPPGQKSPPMGSGVQPLPGRNNPAAKFKWVVLRGGVISKWRVTKDVDNSDIYNVMLTSDSSAGPEGIAFQYGGPGGQV